MIKKEGKNLLGPVEHPWLDPLWRRIVLVAFCCAWTVVEYYLGSTTWTYVVGAIALYAGWAFLIAYKGPDDPTRKTRPRVDENEG